MPLGSTGHSRSSLARSASSGTPSDRSSSSLCPGGPVQIGLTGEAAARYAREWITSISDVTPLAERVHRHVTADDLSAARAEMPAERVYPLPASIGSRIGASPTLPAQLDLL